MVAIFFPEERESSLFEEPSLKKKLREENEEPLERKEKDIILSGEIRREILILHKLGLEDYEIRYLISLKKKREAGFKWEN